MYFCGFTIVVDIINSYCVGVRYFHILHLFAIFVSIYTGKKLSTYSQSSTRENYIRFAEIRK